MMLDGVKLKTQFEQIDKLDTEIKKNLVGLGWVMTADFPDYWQLLPLEDVMEAIIDYRGNTPKKTDCGIPLITAKIVKDGRIKEPSEFIAEEDYESWMVRGLPEIGDVVVTSEAPLGEVAQLSDSNVALAQRIVTLRGKKGVLNNDFLLCAFQSGYVQHQLESRASGSTVKGIKQSELRKVLLPIPPETEQLEIAKHLKVLSDKIELNRQMNQTLEDIAQALFKSWFVDFEPVKAKVIIREKGGNALAQLLAAQAIIAGTLTLQQLEAMEVSYLALDEMIHPYVVKNFEPSGLDFWMPEQLESLANLFPNTLTESELGQIPEVWELTNLKSVTTEIRRGISPKYTEEKGIAVINQKCIRNHTVNFQLARLNDPLKRKFKGREIELGDVLVNSTGVGTLGRLAPVRYLPKPTVFDSHVTIIVRADTKRITKSFLAGLMLENESFIESSGAGSTGQTELRKQVIEDIAFAKPSMALSILYESVAGPINNQIAELEKQQQTLSETRDILLPKLLSGELSVGSAEATLEDALT